ncbi:MAG: hypothetical protein R3E97_22100 [Candidatus Eisenbacteria bacterium]
MGRRSPLPGTDRDWPGVPPAKEIAYLAIPPIHPEEDAAIEEFQVDTEAGDDDVPVRRRTDVLDRREAPSPSVFVPSDCVAKTGSRRAKQ